jgi:hypothetical protein
LSPALVIFLFLINSWALSRLERDQFLLFLGVKRTRLLVASRGLILLSIQPKHRASSTAWL